MSIDQELLEGLRQEMRTGFAEVNRRLDDTNMRLDRFREEVLVKFDGVTALVSVPDSRVFDLVQRMDSIEHRVERLEDRILGL